MKTFFLTLNLIVFSFSAFAEKMNIDTTTLVIEKLEKASSLQNDQSVKYYTLLGRIGDLYAERARQKFIAEQELECDDCKASRYDKQKAIENYEKVISGNDKVLKEESLLQLCFLYQSVGMHAKAYKLLNKIINGKYEKEVKLHAHYALAEYYFSNTKLKDALKHFNIAKEIKDINKRNYSLYRIAWAKLNLGKTQSAIDDLVSILKDKSKMSFQSSNGVSLDNTYRETLAKDLTSFIARSNVNQNSLALIKNLSPEKDVKENLILLADEMERLSKVRATLLVWTAILKLDGLSNYERIKAQLRLAKINLELKDKQLAENDFKKAMQLWKRNHCEDKIDCENLRIESKNWLILWSKIEKSNYSDNLVRSISNYITKFEDDYKTIIWAAKISSETKNWNISKKLFRKASQKLDKDNEKIKVIAQEVEVSENLALTEKVDSYNYFLANSSNGKEEHKVLYQKAYALYEMKKWKNASELFHKVVFYSGNYNPSIRKKAADLSLDSLAILKEHAEIKLKAKQYSRKFKKHFVEFISIYRSALMNIAAQNLKDNSSTSNIKSNFNELSAVTMAGADSTEKIKFYRLQIALSKKLKNLGQVEKYSQRLLSLRSIKIQDKVFAERNLLWAYEMQLKFYSAYRLAIKMNWAGIKREDKYLKLSILAELAGKDFKAFAEEYIAATPSLVRANEMRAKVVLSVRKPWKELAYKKNKLMRTPDIMADLLLKLYAKNPNKKELKKYTNTYAMRTRFETLFLNRMNELKIVKAHAQKVAKHKISRRQSKMQSGIKQRLNLLGQLDQMANTAIRKKDWVLQYVTLNYVMNFNKKMHNDILKLPMPYIKSKKDRVKYQQMLVAEANKYLIKSEMSEKSIAKLWDNRKSMSIWFEQYGKSNKLVKSLMNKEIQQLMLVSQSSQRSWFKDALSDSPKQVSTKEITKAWNRIKKDPFDSDYIEDLMKLEAKKGRSLVVAYLSARKVQVEREVK